MLLLDPLRAAAFPKLVLKMVQRIDEMAHVRRASDGLSRRRFFGHPTISVSGVFGLADAELPDALDSVAVESRIAGDDRQGFFLRLGDEQPVEGVSVMAFER